MDKTEMQSLEIVVTSNMVFCGYGKKLIRLENQIFKVCDQTSCVALTKIEDDFVKRQCIVENDVKSVRVNCDEIVLELENNQVAVFDFDLNLIEKNEERN